MLFFLEKEVITIPNFENFFGRDSREYSAASAISKDIGRYLGYHGLIASYGFYVSSKVQGGFPFDLSSFNVLAVRRIMSMVCRNVTGVKVSPSYNSAKRTIKFTIKQLR